MAALFSIVLLMPMVSQEAAKKQNQRSVLDFRHSWYKVKAWLFSLNIILKCLAEANDSRRFGFAVAVLPVDPSSLSRGSRPRSWAFH